MRYKGRIEHVIKEEIIEGERWCVVINRDNGMGWNWEDMPTRVRENYIAIKRNIEILGGNFKYDNTPYRGSETTIKIPAYVLGGDEESRRERLTKMFMKAVKRRFGM